MYHFFILLHFFAQREFQLLLHLSCFRAVILNPVVVSSFVRFVWTHENKAITVGRRPNQLEKVLVEKDVSWYSSKPSQELCLD